MMDEDQRESFSPAPHALLGGGGSGGHVFPGLAVARELVERGWQVSWAGRADSMEERLVRGRGLAFHALRADAVVGRGALAKCRSLATLARSAFGSRRLIERENVSLVIGTGGFVSVPAVVGGWLARRPTLLLEPNARAGAANRWLSRLAHGAALAWPEAAADLRCPTETTGIPVRREFLQAAGHDTGPPTRLLVLGGSQGAMQLNLEVPRALGEIGGRLTGLEVVHQAGRLRVEEAREAYARAALGHLSVRVEPFLEDVAAEMRRSDLIVSRAGAVTMAEICAAGRAALLVPLALAGAHQIDNAAALERVGGAEMIPSPDLTMERLAAALDRLLTDPEGLVRMGVAARGLARPGAAARIAEQAISMTGGR